MTSSDQDKNRPTAPAPGGVNADSTTPESYRPRAFPPQSPLPAPDPLHSDEQDEIAQLMRTLRNSIPYQEEEKDGDEKWEPGQPLFHEAPEPAPVAPTGATTRAGPEPEAGPGEDDFARLLRNLRESIPDEPEPPAGANAAAVRLSDVRDRPMAEYLGAGLSAGNPIGPAPHEPEPVSTDRQAAELRFAGPAVAPAPDSDVDHRAATDRHYAAEEAGTFEAAPGEAGVFADLLGSLHESTPRRPETGATPMNDAREDRGDQLRALRARNLSAPDPGDDEDEEPEPRRTSPIWKIALMLGAAAAIGLVIAIINPFGESPPAPSSPVVVPAPLPEVPQPSNQVADNAPVVVPVAPQPKPVPPPPPIPATKPVEPPPPLPLAKPVEPSPPVPAVKPVEPPPAPIPAPPPIAVPPPRPAPPPVASLPPAPEPPPAPAPPPVAEPPPAAALSPSPSQPTPPPAGPTKPPAATVAVAPPAVVEAPVAPSKPEPPATPASPPHPQAPHPPAPAAKQPPVSPPVQVAALPPPAATPKDNDSAPTERAAGPRLLTVQLGSFQIPKNADLLIGELKEKGFDAYSKTWTDSDGHLWHVVRVGRLADRAAANALARKLASQTGLKPDVLSVR